MEAADRGDLSTVHDLLVEGMIELRGIRTLITLRRSSPKATPARLRRHYSL
jgi:hypothetical protein